MTSAYVAHQDIAIFVTSKFTKDKVRGRLQTTFAISGGDRIFFAEKPFLCLQNSVIH